MTLNSHLGQPLPASRRGVLQGAAAAPLLLLPHAPRAYAAPAAAAKPVLDQPMRRLRLPKGTVGRDYVLLQLKLGGKGEFDFVVDTGLTAELITPHLKQVLGLRSDKLLETGLGAGGGVGNMELVTLKDAKIVGADGIDLPPLNAVVTDFVQEHMDPEHDPVEGMLGMELLQLFDVDFDFPAGRIRFFRPGEGVAVAEAAGLVDVPAAVLNETGVLGIRATSPKAPGGQPFVGMLDCGASFSALNWQAAALAGLPPRGDRSYGQPSKGQGVAIIGMDGKPQVLPITEVQFTFAGAASKEADGRYRFEAPPAGWRPWQPVQAAVGDLPVFAQLFGDGRTPFSGPAALLGLDVLSQRRLVIGAGVGAKGRARPLLVSPA